MISTSFEYFFKKTFSSSLWPSFFAPRANTFDLTCDELANKDIPQSVLVSTPKAVLNLMLSGLNATSSTVQLKDGSGCQPENAIDGNWIEETPDDAFCASPHRNSHWLQIDLQDEYHLAQVKRSEKESRQKIPEQG